MKTQEEVLKNLFVTLAELQSGIVDGDLEIYLQHKLETLYEILGEDVPEEYWIQVETAINREPKNSRKVNDEESYNTHGGKKDYKYCPICGCTYEEEPALSRKEEGVYICPDCGAREAMEAMYEYNGGTKND